MECLPCFKDYYKDCTKVLEGRTECLPTEVLESRTEGLPCSKDYYKDFPKDCSKAIPKAFSRDYAAPQPCYKDYSKAIPSVFSRDCAAPQPC